MSEKKERVLTDQQKLFLSVLMDEAKGDIREALRLAGYSPGTRPYDIRKTLGNEIVEVAMGHLALTAPKAAHKLTDVLDNPSKEAATNLMKAAAQILDRVGVTAPKEDVNLKVPEGGLFIMPAKNVSATVKEDEDEA